MTFWILVDGTFISSSFLVLCLCHILVTRAEMVEKCRAFNTERSYILCRGTENFGVNPRLGFMIFFKGGRVRNGEKKEGWEEGKWDGLSMLCTGYALHYHLKFGSVECIRNFSASTSFALPVSANPCIPSGRLK